MISSSDRPKQLRLWIFWISTIILHEVAGHLLITWLGNGNVNTPVIMNAPTFDPPSHEGESSRVLEAILFGGTPVCIKDSGQPEDHVSEH